MSELKIKPLADRVVIEPKEAEEKTASDDRLQEIHARLAEIEAQTAESRASKILSGLQFSAASDAESKP